MGMLRGSRGLLPPPIDSIESYWTPLERERTIHMLSCSAVGSPETVRLQLEHIVAETGADELIVASAIYDHASRVQSYKLLAQAWSAAGVQAT